MNINDVISHLLIKDHMIGVRPTGLRLTLSKSTGVWMYGPKRFESARFRAADLLADDWELEAKPVEPYPSEEIA